MEQQQRIAVRPNLNRRGAFTLHRVLKSGRVDYAHALRHTAHDVWVLMEDCTFDVNFNAARRIRMGRSAKFPCASVICSHMEICDHFAPRDHNYLVARFDPRHDRSFVDPFGEMLHGAELVALHGTRAWFK